MTLPSTIHPPAPKRAGRVRRRHRGGVLCAVLLAVAALPMTTDQFAATAVAAGDEDYHVMAFGDPLDFSNQEDLVLDTNEAMFVGGSNKSISDGQLHFDAAGAFQFDPVWAGFATGIPHGREGGHVPIDTSHYTRFVIRMNAPEGAPVGLRWFSCLKQNAECQGGQAFTAHAGWNTYDVRIGDDGTVPGLRQGWTGPMVGLRFVGTVSGHFDIDWIRLMPDGVNASEITGGPSIDLIPRGRLDYATAAGNPWDMDSLGDIAQQVHLNGQTSGNRYSACNQVVTTGKEGDPGLVLNLPSGSIDADRFKTLTFEYSYQGPFSSRTVPNGGMVARVFWSDAGGRHPTQGIFLYPNEHIVQLRLDHPSVPFPGLEPGKGVATGRPWAGRVTAFRLDPNQDPGGRCFTIGRVWLTADEPEGAALPSTVPAVTKAAGTASTVSKSVPTRRRTRTRRRAKPKTVAKK